MMPNIMHNPVGLQVQAELAEVNAEAAANSVETTRLNSQSQMLREQKERVQHELKAAAAASHSAAQVGRRLTVTDCSSLGLTLHLCVAAIALCPPGCVCEPASTPVHPLRHIRGCAAGDVHRLLVCSCIAESLGEWSC